MNTTAARSAAPDVVFVVGTRPEIIKTAPVWRAVRDLGRLHAECIVTGQQPDLIDAFLHSEGMDAQHRLRLMVAGQSPEDFARRCSAEVMRLLQQRPPRCVVVQGDTATAFAGALAAARLGIPVAHIEAGLRTGVLTDPYPEEALRVLISHAASLHFAPTAGNARNLVHEGVDEQHLAVTGNPVVDALKRYADGPLPPQAEALVARHREHRLVLVTAHRRENFGARMTGYLEAIAEFANRESDAVVVFPVHPNPNVQQAAQSILGDCERVELIAPVDYPTFLGLARAASLVISDSGGVQEELATLGTPLVIMRRVTERPEILGNGLARLAREPAELRALLIEISQSNRWPTRRAAADNPFGDGHSGVRIANLLAEFVSSSA